MLSQPLIPLVDALRQTVDIQQDPLRVIVAHLIRETARHAGHADILRERIDDATDL